MRGRFASPLRRRSPDGLRWSWTVAALAHQTRSPCGERAGERPATVTSCEGHRASPPARSTRLFDASWISTTTLASETPPRPMLACFAGVRLHATPPVCLARARRADLMAVALSAASRPPRLVGMLRHLGRRRVIGAGPICLSSPSRVVTMSSIPHPVAALECLLRWPSAANAAVSGARSASARLRSYLGLLAA